MKLGIIARSEDRGLGNQSWEACRHLGPDRVLLVDPGRDGRFEQHPERYADFNTTVVRWEGGRLNQRTVRQWLNGLDVVYSAESPYDLRLGQWAREAGTGLVLHANPEFVSDVDAQVAATWWAATPWRLSSLPPGARVVPMPVPKSPVENTPSDRVRFLHVAGWPAVGDRNGTDLVLEAVRRVTAPCDLIIRGQHKSIMRLFDPSGPVRVRVHAGSVADYWDLYRDADVLILPRRYGGLCLPALEAMASGIPVVMSNCSPNSMWPGPRVHAHQRQHVMTRAGAIPLHDADVDALAATMNRLALDPNEVAELRQDALDWAQGNTWDALRSTWMTELQQACRAA